MTITTDDTRFVAYDYATIPVAANQEGFYRDAYRSFGWSVESADHTTQGVTLHIKRDRGVINKPRLAVLQRQFETAMARISSLERSKTTTAMIVAFTVALIGTAFLAGSVFLFTNSMVVLSVILGVIGLIGWVLPYLLYTSLTGRYTDRVTPQIDAEWDKAYALCAQASQVA